MHLPSSPSQILRGILKSTLFLVEYYGKFADHHDTGRVLSELKSKLKTAIAALEKEAHQASNEKATIDS